MIQNTVTIEPVPAHQGAASTGEYVTVGDALDEQDGISLSYFAVDGGVLTLTQLKSYTPWQPDEGGKTGKE